MTHAQPKSIERQRKWVRFWFGVSWVTKRLRDAAIIIALILNVITISLYVVERNARRDAVNEAVCAIISAVPPGVSQRLDKVRKDFQCGPYIPPEKTSDSPSPNRPGLPKASATPLPVSPPASQPSAPSQPSGGVTSIHSTTNSTKGPAAATSSPGPSISARPSSTPTPLISMICKVLGQDGFCLH